MEVAREPCCVVQWTRRAQLIQDLFWLARLVYLVDIFGMLNVLNITLQGCETDIFEATSKITSFKEKLQSLEEEICNNNLKTLKALQTFMSTCKWGESEQNLEHYQRSNFSCAHSACLL